MLICLITVLILLIAIVVIIKCTVIHVIHTMTVLHPILTHTSIIHHCTEQYCYIVAFFMLIRSAVGKRSPTQNSI